MRIEILKLTATLALWLCGCNMPSVTPQPVTPAAPTQHKLDITVSGTGQVNVAGGADLVVKNSLTTAERCDCGCENESCRCSSRSLTRPAADTSARSGPEIVTTQKVYQCRNGVCGWYDVPVVSSGSASLRNSRRPAGDGKIVVYWQRGNPASEAMRAALKDVKGIDWETSQSPLVNGQHWYPTATIDSRYWVPFSGWDGNSEATFRAWAAQ